jgi:hypothetical protein
MAKKQRRSRQQEEQAEAAPAPHEDAPAAAADNPEEEAAQEAAAEGQAPDAANGGVAEEVKGEAAAAAEEEEREVSFDELGLDEQLKRALRKKGMTTTTPIQREAIPLILVRDFCLPLLAFSSLCLCSVRIWWNYSTYNVVSPTEERLLPLEQVLACLA